MEGIEYYKSLVSDDEVINALIQDSKAREGLLEKPRVRPNLQFFQRTVTNLVSSNNRVTEKQEQIKATEKEKHRIYRPKKTPVKKKLPIQYIREILSQKIDFVKASDGAQTEDKGECTTKQNLKETRRFNPKNSPFQQIRDILSKNVDKTFNPNSQTNLNSLDKKDTSVCCYSESRDIQKSNHRHLTKIIYLSDSDSSDSVNCIEENYIPSSSFTEERKS